MPLFNPVLRQYTPPTCTLEIQAQESPLSRWAGRPVLNKLRFALHFDDPRQPDEQRLTIGGDRVDLEALYETVSTYVQDLLEKSASQLPLGFAGVASNGSQAPISPDGAAAQSLEENSLEPVPVAQESLDGQGLRHLPETPLQLTYLGDRNQRNSRPYLQPRGLLVHDLFLGALATPETGPVVSLSALQLFDLATALDEYAADVVALPKLTGSPLQRIPLPVWAGTAAAALLAVGLTPALIKLMNPPTQTTTVAVVPSPTETPLAPQITPDPNIPSPTPSALVSPLPVPTPSGLAAPQPSPSGLGSALPPPSGLGSQLPTSLGAPSTQTAPGGLSSQAPVQFSVPNRATSPLARNVPQTASNYGFPGTSAPAPSQRTQRQQPRSETNAKKSSEAPSITSSGTYVPSLSNLPPVVSSANRSRQGQPSAKRDTVIPQLSPSPYLPPMTTAPETIPDISTNPAPSAIASNRGVTTQQEPSKPSAQERQQTNNADNVAKGRLFDTIPQVAEARTYFQKRWKPTSGVTKPLEYSLQIGTDGAIERIIPLTEVARNNIDSTGMPLVGEKFVSPVTGGRDANIRVVLNADGKVETFLEP